MNNPVIIVGTSLGLVIGGLSGGLVARRISHNFVQHEDVPVITDIISDKEDKETSFKSHNSHFNNKVNQTIVDFLPVNLLRLRDKNHLDLFESLHEMYKYSQYCPNDYKSFCSKIDLLLDLHDMVNDQSYRVAPVQLRKASTYYARIKTLGYKICENITDTNEKLQACELVKIITEKSEGFFQNTLAEITRRM